MKKMILVILLACTLLIQGCFSYQDMNRVHFITLTLFDQNPQGNDVLYTESFAANRGNTQEGGSAERVLLSDGGTTILDAFYNMQTTSTLPMDYGVNKALVFTENVAKKGIRRYLDGLERNQKLTNKVFLFIYNGDPTELLNIEMEDEQYLGIYLENMMVFQGQQSKMISIRINDYLNERLKGCGVSVLPIIDLKQPIGTRIEVTAAAIMIEDKMVGKISEDEIAVYKALNDELSTGEISIPNPGEEDTSVSMIVLSNRTKDRVEYDKDEVVLHFDITINVNIQNSEGSLEILDDTMKQKLIKNVEDNIKKRCSDLFEKFQERDIDILDVEARVSRRYPNADLEDILDRTEIDVNVNVELDGSQNISDTTLERK